MGDSFGADVFRWHRVMGNSGEAVRCRGHLPAARGPGIYARGYSGVCFWDSGCVFLCLVFIEGANCHKHPIARADHRAEQGYSDPTTGGDYSDLWATILTDWISPIYLLDLAAGDRIHIVQANAGGPYVTKAANIQTQTQPTGSLDVVRDANTGESWVFYADGPSLRCAHERRLVDFPLDSEVDTCLSANSPDRVRAFMSNRILYCVYSVGSFLRLNYSLDAGETWQEMPMLVATNVKLFGATISEDGSSMYLLGKATATDAETNPDDAPEGIIQSGDMVRIVLRRTGENKEWEVTIKEKVTGTLPSGIANLVADIERAGMAFYWFAKKGNDVVLMASDNEMGSFEELDGGE